MTPLNSALKLKDPIVPQIVQALKQAIVEMRFKPGEAISESEIGAMFGVSRQPVREAFIKLSESGLVQVLPSRGTFVAKISVREVLNARFVRSAIECSIAREAASRGGASLHDGLRRSIAAQEEAAERNDYSRFNELDEAFHREIASSIDCDYAWKIVEAARTQTDRVRFLSLPDASPIPMLIAQHRAVAAALESGDPDHAEAAMRTHLREILKALPRLTEHFPDLFSDTDMAVGVGSGAV